MRRELRNTFIEQSFSNNVKDDSSVCSGVNSYHR